MEEVWKQVKGYEGLYEASSLGRIRSIDRTVQTFSHRGNRHTDLIRKSVILRQNQTGGGYKGVSLSKGGVTKTRRVNVLVCEAFHGEKLDGHQVRHLDGDKTNNAEDNLAWGTAVQNQADRIAHGTDLRGEMVKTSKITKEDVLEIRASASYAKYLSKKVSHTQYYRIKNRESWAHVE